MTLRSQHSKLSKCHHFFGSTKVPFAKYVLWPLSVLCLAWLNLLPTHMLLLILPVEIAVTYLQLAADVKTYHEIYAECYKL